MSGNKRLLLEIEYFPWKFNTKNSAYYSLLIYKDDKNKYHLEVKLNEPEEFTDNYCIYGRTTLLKETFKKGVIDKFKTNKKIGDKKTLEEELKRRAYSFLKRFINYQNLEYNEKLRNKFSKMCNYDLGHIEAERAFFEEFILSSKLEKEKDKIKKLVKKLY
jgi:hypothetical protein